MDIKEKQLVEITVGKKCDICGKIEKFKNEFTRFNYIVGGWQGCMESDAYLDVCSGNCFIKACKKIKSDWGSTIQINNFSTDIIKELGELL